MLTIRFSRVLAVALTLVAHVQAHAQSQECIDDADCPMGFACEVVGGSSSVDCDDNGECVPGPVETFSECVPAPLECEVDADCPLGLVCTEQSDDCSVDSEGNESCDPGPKLCSLAFVECSRDTECTLAGYTCQALGRNETCTVTQEPCQPGSDCSMPNLVEECTQDEPIHTCFPRRVDCSSDAVCPGGWQCTELPEDAQDDAPEGWSGATSVCMPEGLALVVREEIALGESDFGDLGGDDQASGGSGTGGGDRDEAEETPDYGPSEGASASGCSVSTTGSHAHGSWLLGLAMLLGARRTRRSRAR